MDFGDFPGFLDFSLYGPREENQASPGVPGCIGVFPTIGWAILRTFEIHFCGPPYGLRPLDPCLFLGDKTNVMCVLARRRVCVLG